MLLALSNVTYVYKIGWFKFLLLKFLYEYGPLCIFLLELAIFEITVVKKKKMDVKPN